jgi:hypothetical protein
LAPKGLFMRTGWQLLTMASLVLCLSSPLEHAMAEDGDPVALTVGRRRLTASELERQLSRVPAFQLAALGSADQAVRRWADAALVPELLYEQEAAAVGLLSDAQVQDRMRAVLAETLVLELERQLERSRPVTDQEMRRRFEQEEASRRIPRRIRLLRILLDDQGRAKKLIEETRGASGLIRWADRARELSLDQATRMRAGDLGFVRPDGSTDVPGLRVDPGLFAAADRVMDGELVGVPVAEAGHFAVIWRRGSLPEQKPIYARDAPALRQSIARARVASELSLLVGELRKNRVIILAESLVDGIPVNPGNDFHPASAPSRTISEPTDRVGDATASPSGEPSQVP